MDRETLSDPYSSNITTDGLGTAYFKRKGAPEFDEKTVDDAVTAIKNGYTHLDGAEGIVLFLFPSMYPPPIYLPILPISTKDPSLFFSLPLPSSPLLPTLSNLLFIKKKQHTATSAN